MEKSFQRAKTRGNISTSRPHGTSGAPNLCDFGDRRPCVIDEYRDDGDIGYRYGYAAYRHFGGTCCDWNTETEDKPQNEWGDSTDWNQRKHAVRLDGSLRRTIQTRFVNDAYQICGQAGWLAIRQLDGSCKIAMTFLVAVMAFQHEYRGEE